MSLDRTKDLLYNEIVGDIVKEVVNILGFNSRNDLELSQLDKKIDNLVKRLDSKPVKVYFKTLNTSSPSSSKVRIDIPYKNFPLDQSNACRLYVDTAIKMRSKDTTPDKFIQTKIEIPLLKLLNLSDNIVKPILIYSNEDSINELETIKIEYFNDINNKNVIITIDYENTTDSTWDNRMLNHTTTISGENVDFYNITLVGVTSPLPTGLSPVSSDTISKYPFTGYKQIENPDDLVRSKEVRWIKSLTETEYGSLPAASGLGTILYMVRKDG